MSIRHNNAPGGTVEWYTPPHIVAAVDFVLRGIGVDPCSNPPPYNIPARLHYTAAENGLYRPWPGTVYCNPPYGGGIDQWITTLRWNLRHKHTTAAIMLVPGSTEAGWFQPLWDADALCFIRGRVRFLAALDGTLHPRNPLPSVMPYWGPDVPTFQGIFERLGKVVLP